MSDKEVVLGLIKMEPDWQDLGQMLGLLPSANKPDKVQARTTTLEKE